MPALRFAIGRIVARVLPDSVRQRQREQAQDQFEERARLLAARLSGGGMTLRDWHASMQDLIAKHLLEQAVIGARGGRLSNERVAQVDQEARRQFGFLSRFADAITGRQHGGTPMSAAALAQRAASYSGAGRAEYYRSELGDAGTDDVIFYRAIDDSRTCSRCIDAERGSPYLPALAPLPGSVCLGRGACRCRLERRRDRDARRRLAA